MSQRHFYFICLWLLILVAFPCVWIFWQQFEPEICNENGPMENIQACFLFLSALTFLFGIKQTHFREQQILLVLIALFCGTLLVLEVDTRKMGIPLLAKLTNGKIRNAWLGCIWCLGAVAFMRNARSVWTSGIAWATSKPGSLMLAAGVFWITSAAIDKSFLFTKSLFSEELMEMNATLLMAASGYLTGRDPSSLATTHLSSPRWPALPHDVPCDLS